MTTSVSTHTFSPLDRDTPVTKVRTATINGEPWFVSSDLCRALGLRPDHIRNLILGADEQQLVTKWRCQDASLNALFQGTDYKLRLLSESGMYKLIMRSDKPTARPFQDWVTKEVLPSIRKTGSYALADHGRTEMPVPAVRHRRGVRAALGIRWHYGGTHTAACPPPN